MRARLQETNVQISKFPKRRFGIKVLQQKYEVCSLFRWDFCFRLKVSRLTVDEEKQDKQAWCVETLVFCMFVFFYFCKFVSLVGGPLWCPGPTLPNEGLSNKRKSGIRARLYERVDNFIQRINPYPTERLCAFLFWIGQRTNFIHWIGIYPLDKVIHSS